MRKDGWALLEDGRYEEAIAKFKNEFQRNKEPLTLGNMGLAYLLAGDPASALVVFDSLLGERFVGTGNYAMAGIPRWILGRRQEAVSVWKKGIGSQYADAAGGMELPLLLYYAAVRDPEALVLSKAKK